MALSDDAPTILVVAGEASGDAHGAAVLRALRGRHPTLRAFGIGGSALRAEGLELLADSRELSVVGILEVLPKIPHILRLFRWLRAAAAERRPAMALLIDSPDFNLRVARKLKPLGIPVLYYVAPQAWAWRRGRVHTLRRLVSRLAVVFPFEERFFGDAGIPTSFVGHPLCDALSWPSQAEAREVLSLHEAASRGPIVAVLPGSRHSELRRHLVPMVQGARAFAGSHGTLLLPVASTIAPESILAALPRGEPAVRLLPGASRVALAAADCAVVASGTATMEAALARVPAVVGYRLSPLTYWLARWLVRTPYVAMPNLLAGRGVYPELLQGALTPTRIAAELASVSGRADEIRTALDGVRAALGGPGAAERVAALATELLASAGTR